jgi:hypothetical protein
MEPSMRNSLRYSFFLPTLLRASEQDIRTLE